MATATISDEIKEQVQKIVDEYNRTDLRKLGCKFVCSYKSKFLYLSLDEGFPQLAPTIRLKFTGDIKKWEFAIFKWSSETYTTDYFFIPGSEFVDGTVLGAMKAGIAAYPPRFSK